MPRKTRTQLQQDIDDAAETILRVSGGQPSADPRVLDAQQRGQDAASELAARRGGPTAAEWPTVGT